MSDEKLWQKRRNFYKQMATVASARTEDQVADNIFTGLGFKANNLWKVEASMGVSIDDELPKIQHARTILNVVSHGKFSVHEGKSQILLDVKDVKDMKKWLDKYGEEYAYEADDREIGVIVCVRGSDPKSLRAVVFVKDTAPVVEPWLLQPESMLLDRKYGAQIWCRKVAPLFRDMSSFLGWDLPGEDDR